MTPSSATGSAIRRPPQQERSRSTVDRVLRAADEEIGACGVAGASTTRIARRAGVSVGAVYRFFDGMDAITDALADRYLQAVTPAYADVVADVGSLTDLDAVVAELLARAAALQEEHPGYYRLSEELAPERGDSPAHRVREHLVAMFSDALGAAGWRASETELRQVVELCIETVRHTLARCPAGHPARETTLAELTRMLQAYLGSRVD